MTSHLLGFSREELDLLQSIIWGELYAEVHATTTSSLLPTEKTIRVMDLSNTHLCLHQLLEWRPEDGGTPVRSIKRDFIEALVVMVENPVLDALSPTDRATLRTSGPRLLGMFRMALSGPPTTFDQVDVGAMA